jgi:hypothetical protein
MTPRLLFGALASALLLTSIACTTPVDDEEEAPEETSAEQTSGCAGKPIQAAVACASRAGAKVMSLYRSPAEQLAVRKQNGCDNAKYGKAGCNPVAADWDQSPHTTCRAVDLVNDGRPATTAALKKCGLAKTTLPHKNHYDFIGTPK